MSGKFHNPYNFIPALSRDRQNSELGDRTPKHHGIYDRDCWSGKISVTLTTETPLLILDAAKAIESEEHKTYPLRVDKDGRPFLPPTSIKGMLRSAYEAVTNSRLSVFLKHGDRLAYRMAAEGNTMIYPARIELTQTGKLQIRILQAVNVFGRAGKLPRYKLQSEEKDKGASKMALPYHESKTSPQHGDRVWVRLNPSLDCENDLRKRYGSMFNNLVDSKNQASRKQSNKKQSDNGQQLSENVVTRIQRRVDDSQRPGNGDWKRGWVCITGANMKGKCYERVFVESDSDPIIPLNEDLQQMWKELILNYQEEHKKDLKERKQKGQEPENYTGDDPGKTGWSTHVYQQGVEVLKEGTLCYVELKQELNGSARSLTPQQVKAIVPVMLSRRLYESSPDALLDRSLHPAQSLDELSPADRVFGWVRQQKSETATRAEAAYKGNLRIRSVVCTSENPIQDLGKDGLPLAILGQPKPQQVRFYGAIDQQGTAHPAGRKKQDGYRGLPDQGVPDRKADIQALARARSTSTARSSQQGLRGRKVYPHHCDLPEGYWNPIWPSEKLGDFYQEYRRLEHEGSDRDNQNRSILAWVKPKAEFQFEIDVTNLSNVELGALLWLLQLEPEHYHRLGSGKPLGFGSIRLEIDWAKTDLRTGADWQEYYRSLMPTETPARPPETTITAFQKAIEQAYGKPFEQVPFIAAFLRAAKGFDDGLPIHYPRIQVQPNSAGEGFKWFMANEQVGGKDNPPGRKLSLPELVKGQGLPIDPTQRSQ